MNIVHVALPHGVVHAHSLQSQQQQQTKTGLSETEEKLQRTSTKAMGQHINSGAGALPVDILPLCGILNREHKIFKQISV
jgi:hypothetical protein